MDEERMKLPPLDIEHIFYAEIIQNGDVSLKDHIGRDILISPITGGYFTGIKLSGIIAGISNSFTYTTLPRRNDLSISFLMKTDDGEQILAAGNGIFIAEPSMETRIMQGEKVDPNDYYHRTQLTFETGSEKYAWLSEKCCFAVIGLKDWTTICMDVYMMN